MPKTEPEASAVKAEPVSDTTAPQQQQDDDEAKPFDPSAEDMDGEHNMPQQNYDMQEVDRTPVHMKDDG